MKKTEVTWRWWVIQLIIPIVTALGMVAIELGHLLGYLPP